MIFIDISAFLLEFAVYPTAGRYYTSPSTGRTVYVYGVYGCRVCFAYLTPLKNG